MTPPKDKDKDQQPGFPADMRPFLVACQGLAIAGPPTTGGSGIFTRDECRRLMNRWFGTGLATDEDTIPAPRHPKFQEFLQNLTPQEIAELEAAVIDERQAREEWLPADVTPPDAGLSQMEPPGDEEPDE